MSEALSELDHIQQERLASLASRRASLLTTAEIWALYGVRPGTIIQWCRRGHLQAVGFAGKRQRLFRKSHVLGILLQRMPEKLRTITPIGGNHVE
jgi:hypothetical protein